MWSFELSFFCLMLSEIPLNSGSSVFPVAVYSSITTTVYSSIHSTSKVTCALFCFGLS